jgi:uncharacterized protein
MIEPEPLNVSAGEASVSALVYAGAQPQAQLILAHGAGAPQRHPFMRRVAYEIAARGITVVTFDFFYSAKGSKRPDPMPVLQEAYLAVAAHTLAMAPSRPLFLGGKSMGSRVACLVSAQLPVRGVVALGYPLVPPNAKAPPKADMREGLLRNLRVPVCILQGERDPFGGPDAFEAVMQAVPLGSCLHGIPGGKHSFEVPKRGPLTESAVFAMVADTIARFCIAQGPGA